MRHSLYVYGAPTCEDTAVTRHRLDFLRIPYRYVDISRDAGAAAYVERLNRGFRTTPTLVFEEIVLAEPSIEQLEATLAKAGYVFTGPRAQPYPEGMSERPLGDFKLPAAQGTFRLASLRGVQKSVLFFAHAPDCLICLGFARQLAAVRPELEDLDTTLLFIVQVALSRTHKWGEIAHGYPVLADEDGRVKTDVARALGIDPGWVFVLMLDVYTALRGASFADDAGGLLAPAQIVQWLQYIDYQCPE